VVIAIARVGARVIDEARFERLAKLLAQSGVDIELAAGGQAKIQRILDNSTLSRFSQLHVPPRQTPLLWFRKAPAAASVPSIWPTARMSLAISCGESPISPL
jgi:hypothetical protein